MYMQTIATKVLEIEIDVLEHNGKGLEGNPFQLHNIWMIQVIKEFNFFIEKLLLLFIKDLQHFLDDHSLTFVVF